jgi:hypothetical protein
MDERNYEYGKSENHAFGNPVYWEALFSWERKLMNSEIPVFGKLETHGL